MCSRESRLISLHVNRQASSAFANIYFTHTFAHTLAKYTSMPLPSTFNIMAGHAVQKTFKVRSMPVRARTPSLIVETISNSISRF